MWNISMGQLLILTSLNGFVFNCTYLIGKCCFEMYIMPVKIVLDLPGERVLCCGGEVIRFSEAKRQHGAEGGL